MPRVPTLNTKTNISTSVPGMQAAPANTATSRAVSGLASTVSNLAFHVAEGQQREKDASGSFDVKQDIKKNSYDFDLNNKKEIDEHGMLNGIPYTEAKAEYLQKVKEDAMSAQKGSMSSDAYSNLDKEIKSSLDFDLLKAKRDQMSESFRKSKIKGRENANKISNSARETGDSRETVRGMMELGKYYDNSPSGVDINRKEEFSKIVNSLVRGQLGKNNYRDAIKTLSLSGDEKINSLLNDADKEYIANSPSKDMSDILLPGQKESLKNHIISTIKMQDIKVRKEVSKGLSLVTAAIQIPGAISKEEVKDQMIVLHNKAKGLPAEENNKLLSNIAKVSHMSDASDMMDTTPPDQWDSMIEKQLSTLDNDTLNQKVAKDEIESALGVMKQKRRKEMKTNFASYSISTNETVKDATKGAMDFNNPEGYQNFKRLTVAHALSLGLKEEAITIIPPAMKNHYAGMLDSTDPEAVINGLNNLKQHVGEQDFGKAVSEISKNQKLSVVTNLADDKATREYIRAYSDPDFSKKWEQYNSSLDSGNKKKAKEALSAITKGDPFFNVLAEMNDNGQSSFTHLNAADTMYKQMRMKNKSHTEAVKAVKDLFVGENAKYDVAQNSDGDVESAVLLPRKNQAGVNKEMVQISIESLKADSTKLTSALNISPERLEKLGITEGKLAEQVSFRTAPDSSGMLVYTSLGEKIKDDEGNHAFVPWEDVVKISERARAEEIEINERKLQEASQFKRSVPVDIFKL